MISRGYPVRIDRRVFVTMSDGTRIALTSYLPDAPNDGPFPTVVESLPYRKDDDCYSRDHSTYTYLGSRGFAGIRIDVRGTGASRGVIHDEYLAIEQADNIEVLDWVTAQEWSNGNVGMWGISWGGFSALQTAMLRPPQLKAIAAMHATHDRFACDVHYTGGSLHAGEQADWPPSMITTNALPPDPDIVGDGWYEEWLNRLENTPQWHVEWLRHQRRDEYWMHGSPAADYSSIECPTLLVGGWLDGYIDGITALAENLSCPTRTVIGPWGHYRPATGKPGPTFDHFDLLARWFGHHLRGDANDVMDLPAVTAYIRSGPPFDGEDVAGHWRAEPAWPPPGREVTFTLAGLQHARVVWDGPQWVGSHAPAWDRSGIASSDGAEDDQASLSFDSAPLEETMEILGTPRVELGLSSNREVGMVAARLLVVSPQGESHLICRGNRNLAFPSALSDPRRPEPGEPLSISFPLMATSAVLPVGSRLRLALSGADFPVVWPPGEKFTLTIDPATSMLVIPVVDQDADKEIISIPEPIPAEPPGVQLLDEADWSIRRNGATTFFKRHIASRELQADRGMLTYGSEQTWTVSVADDDPGSTRVEARSVVSLEREGWDISVVGTLEISGRSAFDIVITLDAFTGGSRVWKRRWEESIPRKWV
ncbi:MAG: CocE/NonD family hydrolase [Acidimicrobiia bacterium]